MDDLISKQEAIDRLSEVLSNEREFENAKQVLIEAPTLDEKEIIRKPFERVVERLEEKEREAVLKAPITSDIYNPQYQKWMMKSYGFKESIQVVKEEGGIE